MNALRSLWMVNVVGGAVSMATVQHILPSPPPCKPIRSSLLSCCEWKGENRVPVPGGGAVRAAGLSLWSCILNPLRELPELWPPLVALDHLEKIHSWQRNSFFSNTKNGYKLTEYTKTQEKKNEQRVQIGISQKRRRNGGIGMGISLSHS